MSPEVIHAVPKVTFSEVGSLVFSPDIGPLNPRLMLLSAMSSLPGLCCKSSVRGPSKLILPLPEDRASITPALVFASYIYRVADKEAYYSFLCEVYPSGNSPPIVNPYTLSEEDYICRFEVNQKHPNGLGVVHLVFDWLGETISTHPESGFSFAEIADFYFSRRVIAYPPSEYYSSENLQTSSKLVF